MVLGTTLEWYDMFLYGSASALLFGRLFFPAGDPVTGVALAFAVFGVGYAARPLGAVVFGHIGDRFGRKATLVATLILMGGATTLMGLLPTYAAIGFVAPLLLVVLRLLQGMAAGAEYAGALVMLSEAAPRERRGFFSSIPGIGIYLGIILSSAAVSAIFLLPEEDLYSWGWRVPFLISAVLVVIGIYVRRGISESPVFAAVEEEKVARKTPIVQVLRTSKLRVIQGILLSGGVVLTAPIVLTYSLVYSAQQGTDRAIPLVGTLIGALLGVLVVPYAGHLTDKYGRKPVYYVLAIMLGVFPFLFFGLLSTNIAGLVLLAHALAAPMAWAMTGAQASYLSELFPSDIRLSGVALARELSGSLLAAPAPLIALGLAGILGGAPWLVAGMVALLAVATIITLITLPETRGLDLTRTSEERKNDGEAATYRDHFVSKEG